MTRRASLLGLLAALSGCGSATIHDLPRAAEPPRSPALQARPAGTVIAVGDGPEGVAAAAGRFAVALRDPDELAFVDARGDGVVQRVPLPGAPRHLQASGDRILVPAEDADMLLIVGARDGRVEARVPVGRQPHDAAGAGASVYVGDEGANTLTVVRGDREVAKTRVFTQPGGVTTLDGGRTIVVVSVRERRLELLDARTLRRLASTPVGVGPTHVVCLQRGICYVADTIGGALLVVRRDPLRVARRVYLPGGPYGLALDRERNRIWVTLPGRNVVAELPAHGRPHVLATYPTVRQPDTVAVDPASGVVAVTGRAGGELQLLPPRAADPR